MIEVEGLIKRYGELTAVDGAGFRAREGEIYGLLGPNGAGKSTTLGCIGGLLRPSSGRVSVLGHDVVHDGRRPVGTQQDLGRVGTLAGHRTSGLGPQHRQPELLRGRVVDRLARRHLARPQHRRPHRSGPGRA